MKRFATDCDRCGSPDPEGIKHFGIALKRYTDASGSMDTESITFDLCPECQGALLGYMLRKLDWNLEAEPELKKLVPNAQIG